MKQKILTLIAALVLTGPGFSSALAAELGGVEIHGFVSQGFIISDHYNYLAHNSAKGSFEYNELGINLSKELNEQLRMGIQLFSRDLGDAGNNKITIDWAYGDFRLNDALGIRAGRIKLPLGFYNETRDIDLLRTHIVMPQSIYPDLLRDTVIAVNGGGIYGSIDLLRAGSIDYQGIAGQPGIDNESGYEKYFNHRAGGRFSVSGEADSDITFSASLKWNTPLEGLVIGVSALDNTIDTPVGITALGNAVGNLEAGNRFYTAGIEYTWNDLVVAGEYQRYYMDSILTHGSGLELLNSTTPSEGYYLSASCRFTDIFSLGSYYSVFYVNKDNREGNGLSNPHNAWEKDLALSLRFDINDYLILKLEGHYVDGLARVIKQDNPLREKGHFTYGVAKVTFSF